MISPYSLRPLSGILAHFNLSNWRAIALLKASDSSHSKHGSNSPSTAVPLLECLHPLLPALWKSPALKYRRRRGNGGRTGGQRGERIRTPRIQL